ncbi:acyl-CoA dehydrogenase family protein, partial [Streptomyces sp. TRM76130]|nr:acyl-CoA dehydrogenase family protein [Streptomyces sp. TRM76130]
MTAPATVPANRSPFREPGPVPVRTAPRPPSVFAEFARTHIAPRAEAAYRAEILDRLSWQRLADLGLWRAGVPERLGGTGGNWRDLAERIADVA